MKSKILILTNPLNHEGGVVNYYNLYFKHFKSKNFELKHQNIGSRDWVFYYPIFKIIVYPFFYGYDILIFILNLLFVRKIKIVQLSPSLIPVSLFRDGFFIIIAKIFKKKIVVFYRGWRIETFHKIKNNKFLRILFNLTFQQGTNQVVLATSFKENLIELSGKQGKEIMVTTTAINKNDIVFSTINKNKNVIKVLFLARIEDLKGADEIIKAISKLNKLNKLDDFEFTFVGHENVLGYINNLKQQLNNSNVPKNKVIFKGRIIGTEKFQQYANHDVYILPSYTEGCPTSVLEALASGLFCITTPVGALAEIIVPNKNGILINIKSVDDIINALDLCQSNINLLNNRSQISNDAIGHFEITNICNKFNLFYNKIYS